MLIQLKLILLQLNLSIQYQSIEFILQDKNRLNNLPEDINYSLTDDHVLLNEVIQVSIPQTQFIIDVQNPQEHKILNLYVISKSNLNSKRLLLGPTELDINKIYDGIFQNGNKKIFQEPITNVQNLKGSISFEINTVQPHFQLNEKNLKSTESLDKEQTMSSDSFDANLHELNKCIDLDYQDHKFKFTFQNSFRNPGYTHKIILEEIDLEDNQDDSLSDISSKSYQPSKQSLIDQPQLNISSQTILSEKNSLKKRFNEEKIKIAFYLHHLQETDFFMMRIQERLQLFNQQ